MEFNDHVVAKPGEFADNRLQGLSVAIRPQAFDVFEENMLRPLGLADPDDVMEEGPAGIVLSFA